ncbi:MAG: glycosyltransferase family A protein, partial [Gemmatimonadota bacterium]
MSASTADRPPHDVLIATHGRARLLARTLDSLIEAELPSTMRRVLVVENGPPSGAEDVCRARADRLPLDYMHVAEGNKSRALNTGVQALEPGLIYFVDDDVRVSPHGPEAYVDAAARYGPGHHFGGPVHVDRDDEPP